MSGEAYPDFDWCWDGDETESFPIDRKEGTNGAVHLRILGDTPRRTFPLVHPELSWADVQTILAHWEANAASTFQWSRALGGQVFVSQVGYLRKPMWEWARRDKFIVRLALVEV